MATTNQTISFDPALTSYKAIVGQPADITITLTRTVGGQQIVKTLHVPVSGAVTDELSQQIAAAVPAGFTTARTNFEAALNALLDAGALAGKINFV